LITKSSRLDLSFEERQPENLSMNPRKGGREMVHLQLRGIEMVPFIEKKRVISIFEY
jgi:hypothetical protein